jgi:hypothetical protein
MSWSQEDKWVFLTEDSDFCWPPKPAQIKILKDGCKIWLSKKNLEYFNSLEGKLVVYDYCSKTPDHTYDYLVYTDSNGYKYWNRISFLELKTALREIVH